VSEFSMRGWSRVPKKSAAAGAVDVSRRAKSAQSAGWDSDRFLIAISRQIIPAREWIHPTFY